MCRPWFPLLAACALLVNLAGFSWGAAAGEAKPQPLFDGTTFAGWEGDTTGVWKIEHGMLVAGTPDKIQPTNDFLCTTREFADFELRLSYRNQLMNGGIQFRSQRVPNSYEVCGYQADFFKGGDGCLYDEARRRKMLARPDADTVAKLNLGEWNRYRIRAEGARIRLWVNDVLTVDYTETDPAIPRRGIIGLQIHKNARQISYRDVEIIELPPSTSATWSPDPGWTSLGNGRDLQGWHYQGEPDLGSAREATDGRYRIEDGMLVVQPEDPAKGPHLRQLWTLQEFPQDFILRLEFRASVDADSGIFIRGPQLQCRDYAVAGPWKNLTRYRPQDWNQIEVTVRGLRAAATCNGEPLGSGLTLPATGPLGLEADRGRMEYRHLQWKPLP